MASALVQAPTPTDAGPVTSLNRTFGSTPASGNLLTAHMGVWHSTVFRSITFSDNKGNTYSYFTAGVHFGANVAIRGGYATNITTSATHTVTGTLNDAGNCSLGCAEWSGVETSPTTSFNSGNGSSTAPSSGSVSPSGASLIVGCCAYDGSATTIAVGSGYTQAFEADENNDNQAQNCEYKVGASGSQTATWTLAASRAWGAYVGAFSEVAAGFDAGVLAAMQQRIKPFRRPLVAVPFSERVYPWDDATRPPIRRRRERISPSCT